MLADVADEIDEAVVLHPVVVVYELGLVGGVGIKVQETGQLGLEAGHIVGKRFFVQQVAFRAFHGRVSDHAGGTADEGDGLVAAALEVFQNHHAYQVADVQGIGRGVNAYVGRLRAFHQFLFRSGHDVLDHASPGKLLNKIDHIFFLLFSNLQSYRFLGKNPNF